ncbi:MAG TPA: KH domain-containing protein [Edaphobacter sp.]|nr:KH domain-containing protein [Edaphobacter sp.]
MDVAMQDDGSITKMSNLVAELARALVDSPDEVVVEAIPDGDGTLLRLHVAAGDVGKVIGKQGRTARSIRTVLSAASMKLKRRFSLDIVEEARPS